MAKANKTTVVSRVKGATHKEEMQRRKERREAESANMAPMTKERFLRTGSKYIPAGRFKNIQPHNR